MTGTPFRPTRRAPGARWASALALLTTLFLALGAAPGHADGGQPVVAGTWHLTITVPHPGGDPLFAKPGKRTWFFGAGCAVGSDCKVERTTAKGKNQTTAMTSGAKGFSFSGHQALNCFNTDTGELSTVHGADYNITAHLAPSAFEVRDGVRYATAMAGAYDEVVRINAKGRADNCTADGKLVRTQRSVIRATMVPLAAAPSRTSDQGLAIDPDTVQASGTLDRFTLATTTRQEKSVQAVEDGRRSAVPAALTVPSEALHNVGDRVGKDLLLLALLGLLMVFPAMLFNSTYEENHERIDRVLGRVWRRRSTRSGGSAAAPTRGRRIAVFLGCALVGTVLGGLLDPRFGANTASYALLLGVFCSVLVAVLLAAVTGRVFRSATHRDHGWYLRAIPSALLIAVLCVVVSRVSHFSPGYLYGVLGGAVFAAALERKSEGRAEVTVFLVGLLVALGAWVAFEPVAKLADGSNPSFGVLSLDAFLASLFIGGVEGLLFGLVPLRFLPGHRIRGWSWVAWGLLAAVVLFVFVHVLLLPQAGYLGRSTVVSVNLTVGLFAAFGVASVLFWLWFRMRPTVEEASEEDVAPSEEGAVDESGEPVAGPPEPDAEPVPEEPETEPEHKPAPALSGQEGQL